MTIDKILLSPLGGAIVAPSPFRGLFPPPPSLHTGDQSQCRGSVARPAFVSATAPNILMFHCLFTSLRVLFNGSFTLFNDFSCF